MRCSLSLTCKNCSPVASIYRVAGSAIFAPICSTIYIAGQFERMHRDQRSTGISMVPEQPRFDRYLHFISLDAAASLPAGLLSTDSRPQKFVDFWGLESVAVQKSIFRPNFAKNRNFCFAPTVDCTSRLPAIDLGQFRVVACTIWGASFSRIPCRRSLVLTQANGVSRVLHCRTTKIDYCTLLATLPRPPCWQMSMPAHS